MINQMLIKKDTLYFAIFTAIISWGLSHMEHKHDEWEKLITPQHLFTLLGVIASVWGGWKSGNLIINGDKRFKFFSDYGRIFAISHLAI